MNEEKKNYTQRGDIMARTRKAAVNLINSWVGKNEKMDLINPLLIFTTNRKQNQEASL